MARLILTVIRRIYTSWCFLWFFLIFLLLWPFFWLFLQRKEWHWLANWCNRIWAVVVYTISLLPLRMVYKFKPQKGQVYVFCANHSSYIDIPVMLWGVKQNFCFMGKSSLAKVPLIGYMYKKLNILVDRKNPRSRVEAYEQAGREVEKGNSLVMFPEGTIAPSAPFMGEYKEGAFKIAIAKQIPIVPVTIPYNWLILPDDGKWLGRPHVAMAVFHEPIETKGMTLDDLPYLKEKTREVIEKELIKRNPSIFN